MFSFNPTDDDGNALHDLKTDVVYGTGVDENGGTFYYEKKIDYNTISSSFPFGVGVKYSLGSKLGIAVEWRWDYTLTDWIDDCHAYYPSDPMGNDYSHDDIIHADPTGFSNDPGESQNKTWYKQRGNKEDNDWFGYLNLSIVYKFIIPGANDCKTERKNAYNTY